MALKWIIRLKNRKIKWKNGLKKRERSAQFIILLGLFFTLKLTIVYFDQSKKT